MTEFEQREIDRLRMEPAGELLITATNMMRRIVRACPRKQPISEARWKALRSAIDVADLWLAAARDENKEVTS